MWIIDQLAHGLPTYTTPMAIRFHGPLSKDALVRSLNEIICRHEILRTMIRAPEGRPLQFVMPSQRLTVPAADFTHLPGDAREKTVSERLRQEARSPLDPATRVIRAKLFRLGPDDHILYLAVHHIAWDGWSISVFYSELTHLYECFLRNAQPTLPELPIQYADFAIWQRDRLCVPEHLEYWATELADGIPPLDLPTDHPRGPNRSSRGEVAEWLVSAERTRRFKAFARADRVTLAMLVSTGLHAVLHRCASQPTVATGFPSANRNRQELEGLIGFFVNPLVLRTDYSGDLSFRELLRQVRAKTLHALRHDDLPFERLVEALAVERDPGQNPARNPLVQVSLAFQNATDAALLDLPGLDAEVIELHSGTCQDEFGLYAWERDGGLMLVTEYSTDLYGAGTAGRLLRRIERLIDAGCADPERPVAELPLLTEDEQIPLSRAAHGPAPAGPLVALHELVEQQATMTPDGTAVIAEDETLTYRELNERANRLARRLRRHGVGPHEPVAVHLERSAAAAVAILGVLKLGAYYLPLDPSFPAARTEFMVADVGPSAVITADRFRDRLPDTPGPVISLDEEFRHLAAEPGHDLEVAVDPGDVAYVIYTSGTTGRPKGVMVPHRGVCNLVRSLQEQFKLTPADRLLHASPLTFDPSVAELIWPLACGAAAVTAPEYLLAEPRTLARFLAGHGITVAWLVPSVLAAYLAAEPPGMPRWRVMMCVGEVFSPDLLRRFRAYAPGARVANGYGPTEASIGVTRWEIPREDEIPPVVPIGRAMAGTQCHVLDEALHRVPVATTGELYIGGAGVAYGYVGRPGLTAERFVPSPFADGPGARLYRTGDIVRVNADGAMEFVGRADDQIKLNGIRIEPREIQVVLEAEPGVAATRVMIRRDEQGRDHLVAYLVGHDGTELNTKSLRAAAAAHLPRTMIPARFVVVDRLPLTPTGKLDTRRLPDLSTETVADGRDYVAPRTEVERVIAEHIGELLGHDRVGRYNDFFELGGNSLQAAQITFLLRRAFGVEVLLRDLFQASSVIELAKIVDRGRVGSRTTAGPDPLVCLNDREGSPLFLVHPVSGAVFCYAGLAKGLDRPLYAFQALGLESDHAPLTSIPEMAAGYVAALRAHRPAGGRVIGGWSVGGLVALEMARQLRALGEPVERLLLIDAPTPITEPLWFSDAEVAMEFARDVAASAGEKPPADVALNGSVDDMADTLLGAGLVRGITEREVLKRRLQVYQATLEAAMSHADAPDPYPGAVAILSPAASADTTRSWRERLSGPVIERLVPGDHYSMFHGANLAVLARHMLECLGPGGRERP